MNRKRDKFACVNENKKRSGMVVFAVAVLAICISGALCARRLQLEQRYISLNENPVSGILFLYPFSCFGINYL